MRYTFLLSILTILGLMAVSCRKGELPEENYFGKVEVSLLNLPNTPDIEVRLAGKKLNDDAIVPGASRSFVTLSKDQQQKLEIFKAHTDTLLSDTMINIPSNSTRSLRFAYSKEIGLEGFVTGGDVSPDSIKLQFLNGLGDYYAAYPSMDFQIGNYDFNTGDFVETGLTIKDFSKVKLAPQVFTLPIMDRDGNPLYYYGRFKNTATGEYIPQPNGAGDWFYINSFPSGGVINIIKLYDTDGSVSIEVIEI